MTEFEEEEYIEVLPDSDEEDDDDPKELLRARENAARNYAVFMKTMDIKKPTEREVHNFRGLLGLNPGFVLIQDTQGSMLFASEWSNVWCVKVVPDAAVISIVRH